MKKLNKFLLLSYIGPFVLTFFVALFVLLMQFLWKYVDDFVGKGFDWYVIAELMFYASATFVPMALPLAVLLSSLMTFGNLGENYELVAIKSSGISLQKIMQPLVIFIIFVSIGAFYFSNYVLPKANLEFLTLLSDVRRKKPAVSIKEGVFNSGIGNYVIKVGKKNPDGVGIEDVIIYDHSKHDGNTNVTRAQSGKMEMSDDKRFLILSLKNGISYNEDVQQRKEKGHYPIQVTHFSKEIQRIDLSDFVFKKSDKNLRRNNYQMLNVHQLLYFEDSLMHQRNLAITRFQNYAIDDLAFYKNYFHTKVNRDSSMADSTAHSAPDSLRAIAKGKEDREVEHPLVNDTLIGNRESFSGLNNGLLIAKAEKEIAKIKKIMPKKSLSRKAKIKNGGKAKLVNFYFKDNILAPYDSLEQVRIVVGALSMARNASYQASNTYKLEEARDIYISKYKVEWHRKYTLSFACLILFFIGAPLGAIIRKGGLGMPLVISILMFVLYHVFTIIGEKSVKSQVMDPWLGMWMASLIYLPLGVFLTWKATTDAPLFDAEAWSKFFNKINIFRKLKKHN